MIWFFLGREASKWVPGPTATPHQQCASMAILFGLLLAIIFCGVWIFNNT